MIQNEPEPHQTVPFSGLDKTTELSCCDKFEFFPICTTIKNSISALYVKSHDFSQNVPGVIRLVCGDRVVFDGYFSALYERELAEFLGDAPLELRLCVKGAGRAELWHCSVKGQPRLVEVAEIESPDAFAETRLAFALAPTEALRGRWWFALKAHGNGLWLREAGWRMASPPLRAVRPEIVICTYRREAQATRNVSQLQALLEGAGVDFGVTVVDNGATLARAQNWGARIKLIAQRNVGGAGGFARGILETLRAGRATHIILMDDDAEIDDVSVLRMINLFRLNASAEIFFGGAQLDVFDPLVLADSGAFWRPSDFEKVDPRLRPCEVTTENAKNALAARARANFNGWWFFGGAVESFRRFGMPLPCFVHLDDVEYGVRIAQMGGRIVAPPGVAIWHEPFYAKLEGWFAYYNIRNELIRYCLQTEKAVRPWRVLHRLHKRHRDFVVTRQYGAAAALARAVEDFLRGPKILLDEDPERLHAEMMDHYRRHSANACVKTVADLGDAWRPARPTRGLKRLLAPLTSHGHFLPARALISDTCLFESRSAIHRGALFRFAAWAYCESGSDRVHMFTLDRTLFKTRMAAMLRAEWRFVMNFARVAKRWRASAPALRGIDYWEKFPF